MDAIEALQRQWASRSGDASNSSNPITALAENIQSWLYGNPGTPGFSSFKARLILLDCMLVYLSVSGLVCTILHFVARRRSHRASWIVKRVAFPDGSGVIIFEHYALVFLFCVVLLPTVGLAHLGTSTVVFLKQAPQHTLNGWRLAGYTPIFLAGWCMSWNCLLGFLLVAGDKFPRFLRGKHLNLVTLGGGFLLASALVVLTAIGGFKGRKIWQIYTKLQGVLSSAAVEYDARDSLSDATMAVVTASYTDWRCALQEFYGIFKVLLAFFAVLTVVAASVNCCTFALVMRLRQHIRESIDNIAGLTVVQPIPIALNCDKAAAITPVPSPDSPSPLTPPPPPAPLKRAHIRKAAAGKFDLGVDRAQAQRLVDLTRVERERIILCVVHLLFCLVIEAYCISSLVIISRRRRTWVENEFILTFPWYLCGFVGSICTTALAINEIVHMPPRCQVSAQSMTSSSAPNAGGGSNSIAQQVRVDVTISREVFVAAPDDEPPMSDALTTWSPVSADGGGQCHKENWA
ncbi:hypothetical protein ACM66B_006820 [Microbotryomycetes sp. NB124-2]